MGQERDQCVASVEVPLVMLQVVVREQHLGNAQIEASKELLVNGHQPRLADRGTGLQLRQVARPPLKTQYSHARPDCAGRHEHDFFAGLPLFRSLRY